MFSLMRTPRGTSHRDVKRLVIMNGWLAVNGFFQAWFSEKTVAGSPEESGSRNSNTVALKPFPANLSAKPGITVTALNG